MNTEKLDYLLQRIEDYIDSHEVLNTNVSKVAVGWHLDHSLKVINGVISTLKNSNPKEYKNNFSFIGKLFFALGFFPRGKAKAPKHVKPPEVVLKEDIIKQLAKSKNLVKELPNVDKNSFFKHPLFGNVNKKRVTKFLDLHTSHHLKIVRDILKSCN